MTGHARISLAAWGATVLGALVLTPVFSGPFLFISALLCAVITGVGVLLQNLRTPRAVVPLVQLVVLVELLSIFFLKDTLKFGLIPWKATALEFNQQMVNAMDSINRFSAPLPPDSHLTLFAVSVISATGLLIHIIAVQLRQAAWAGLLLLIMYTVPAATVHGGLPAVLFIPPAVGYILLLSAEGRSRLSRWGRRISGVSHLDAAEPVEASALGQAGRRIGLSVVALAALLPALLPALPEGVIGNGLAGSGPGGGLGTSISSTDPMLDMAKNLKQGENVVALTYKGGPSGGTYLRLTALDLFDGNTWRISPREDGHKINGDLTPPPGYIGDLSKVPQTKMEIDVTRNFRSQFVPVPYPLHSISLKRDWRYDAGALDIVSAGGQVIAGKKYSVTSYDLQPTPDQLSSAVFTGQPDQYTSAVPQRTPTEIKTLTDRIIAGADGNKFEAAVLLQQWFRSAGGFTYSTRERPRQRDARDPRLPAAEQVRVLRAVRDRDGADGTHRGHPVPGRHRLPARSVRQGRAVHGPDARHARLAGAVLPGHRLGPLRADPGRAGGRHAELDGRRAARTRRTRRRRRAPHRSRPARPTTPRSAGGTSTPTCRPTAASRPSTAATGGPRAGAGRSGSAPG